MAEPVTPWHALSNLKLAIDASRRAVNRAMHRQDTEALVEASRHIGTLESAVRAYRRSVRDKPEPHARKG